MKLTGQAKDELTKVVDYFNNVYNQLTIKFSK